MSGHSKWATIKHKKASTDAKRGKMFTKLIKELTVAARMGGGDIGGNPRLRKAVDNAKGFSMPADTIKRAILRGTGDLEGVDYVEVLYEGTGPGGTLFLVEGLTDNRNRTVADLRMVFDKNGGVLGSSGTANWAFDRKGVITVLQDKANEDQLMEIAVGAGADDYESDGEEWSITTPPESLTAVVDALETAKIPTKTSNLVYVPKSKKEVTGRDAEIAMKLADAIDDNDDVQNVFSDFDISDEEMARIVGE